MDIFLAILSLVGFVALTAATGLFVAIEFSLTGLERSTIEADDTPLAKKILAAQSRLSFHLSGAQVGITVTTLATGYLAQPTLSRYFTPLLTLIGLPEGSASGVALVLAIVVATVLSMVCGELVPKNIAITNPLGTAKVVLRPVLAFNWAFTWLIKSLNVVADALVKRMGIQPSEELASARTAQELGALVRNSAVHGGIDRPQALLIDRSLRFGDMSAEDIMTPRSTIKALDRDDSITELLACALETGHSRFPVIDGDLDTTLGVVHVKAAFTVPAAKRDEHKVETIMVPMPTIPASLDGDAVLKTVRQAGCQMALVADEYGGTAGIVTIEDVVEEIMGDVFDEHDDALAEQDFRKSGTSWDCSGLVRIDELTDRVGYHAADGPYETLGGLIMSTLNRIPEAGDTLILPTDATPFQDELHGSTRWSAQVVSMDGRRVDRALLTPVSVQQAEQLQRELKEQA